METKLIEIFSLICQIYDNCSFLKYQPESNFKPKFSDEEIFTIYLFGQLNDKFKNRQFYEFITQYWVSWFPILPPILVFNRRFYLLNDNFQVLFAHLLPLLHSAQNQRSSDYLIDS